MYLITYQWWEVGHSAVYSGTVVGLRVCEATLCAVKFRNSTDLSRFTGVNAHANRFNCSSISVTSCRKSPCFALSFGTNILKIQEGSSIVLDKMLGINRILYQFPTGHWWGKTAKKWQIPENYHFSGTTADIYNLGCWFTMFTQMRHHATWQVARIALSKTATGKITTRR